MSNYLKRFKVNKVFLFFLFFILNSCSSIDTIIENSKKLTTKKATNLESIKKSPLNFNVSNSSSENLTISSQDSIIANPIYKIGDPYEINDIWYYPERDLKYNFSGIASWYGDKFHGKLTANGEIFNKNIVSAAHKTLPLPSMVRVTNLDNGKVLNIRINDRGPYAHGRIIDLSEKAAELLGFKELGTARVNVKILTEQSLLLERNAKEGNFNIDNQINDADLPKLNSVIRPKVIVNGISENHNEDLSVTKFKFTDLIKLNKIGLMNEIDPVETNIWIQVGAFSSIKNAEKVINIIKNIFSYDLSSFQKDGQILHRVRLGPTQELTEADIILKKVFELGYNGSKIIVE